MNSGRLAVVAGGNAAQVCIVSSKRAMASRTDLPKEFKQLA
jgi:hypothetical protein